jgi:hypothetical protein
MNFRLEGPLPAKTGPPVATRNFPHSGHRQPVASPENYRKVFTNSAAMQYDAYLRKVHAKESLDE